MLIRPSANTQKKISISAPTTTGRLSADSTPPKPLPRSPASPFRPLSAYDRKVVHGYVGSMYAYAKDVALKNAPEDFVYHVPRDVTYTATYIDYTIDKNYRVVGESRPRRGIYFQHYRDGSAGAYCTFMGGDTRLAVIRTSTPGNRRLIILKDSFGNTLPGYLFYSFSEIHVIDSRYFTKT